MGVLVIDGYNVIARGMAVDPRGVMGSDDARFEAREELVRLAKRYGAGKKGLEVRIYFDGSSDRAAPELSDRTVKVFFAKGDQGADNAIIRFCKAYARPKEIEVASDDWGTLGFHVRAHVGKLLSVAELMRRLRPGDPSAGVSRRQDVQGRTPAKFISRDCEEEITRWYREQLDS
ncbi:MAG: NYN domain-containing protein [Candidatus Omnitrophica bacterium]|nr:NYN domain-containing protein [Candidatus Omnitrophota bacterium]